MNSVSNICPDLISLSFSMNPEYKYQIFVKMDYKDQEVTACLYLNDNGDAVSMDSELSYEEDGVIMMDCITLDGKECAEVLSAVANDANVMSSIKKELN